MMTTPSSNSVTAGALASTRHGQPEPGIPTLVLMHFLGGSQREWDDVLPLLSPPGGPQLAAVTLDLPGFGSSAGQTGYTVSDMADSVGETLDALNLPCYVLVGHSMSGKVAAVLARRAEEAGDTRLAGLVLIAPSPPAPEPMTEEKRNGMIAALGQPSDDSLARARSYITKNEQRDIPRAVEMRAANEVLRMNRTAWVAWLTGGSREDWGEYVGILNLPALVVAGEKDASLGPDRQQELTLPHLLHGRMETVSGCSHLVPMERPRELAILLQQFIHGLGE